MALQPIIPRISNASGDFMYLITQRHRPLETVFTLFDVNKMSKENLFNWLKYRNPFDINGKSEDEWSIDDLKMKVVINFATHIDSPPLGGFLDFNVLKSSTSFLRSWLGSFGLQFRSSTNRVHIQNVTSDIVAKRKLLLNTVYTQVKADIKTHLVSISSARGELRRLFARLIVEYILPYEQNAPELTELIGTDLVDRGTLITNSVQLKNSLGAKVLALSCGPDASSTDLRRVYCFQLSKSENMVRQISMEKKMYVNLNEIGALGWVHDNKGAQSNEAVWRGVTKLHQGLHGDSRIFSEIIRLISSSNLDRMEKKTMLLNVIRGLVCLRKNIHAPTFTSVRDAWVALNEVMKTDDNILKNKKQKKKVNHG